MSERCLHAQAVPVHLSTGELVACLCTNTGCLEQLPPGYIDAQLDRAWRAAHCTHGAWIDVPDIGRPQLDQICQDCGDIRSVPWSVAYGNVAPDNDQLYGQHHA